MILQAKPRTYQVSSKSKAFKNFRHRDYRCLGSADSDMVKKAIDSLRPKMSPEVKLLCDLKMIPSELHEAIEKDILIKPVGSKGGWYEIAYRKNSSISYLRRPGGEIKLHPFDGKYE